MASTLDKSLEYARETEPAAVIDAAEFEEARRDPRLRRLIDEADSYIAELDKTDRNR